MPRTKRDNAIFRHALTALALTAVVAGNLASPAPASSGSSTKVAAPTAGEPVIPPHSWWVDDNVKPKVVLVAIHGLGLHKGTFEAFGKELAKSGIATYAIDVRGFGAFTKANGERPKMDFTASLADVHGILKAIHKVYPGLPVVLIGESMGGAIAMRATAMYPDLVSGLISSVPAGDRFNKTDQELKVALHALLSGFNKPMNVGKFVVRDATQKEELRKTWENDPMARLQMTPNELIAFNQFMKQNFDYAKQIKKTPVLFIQGINDKLVRPAGTWKLCQSLGTPNKQLVMSKNAEHLIFEEGQFNKEDMSFILTWIDKNVTELDRSIVATDKELPAVASSHVSPGSGDSSDTNEQIASSDNQSSANPVTAAGTAGDALAGTSNGPQASSVAVTSGNTNTVAADVKISDKSRTIAAVDTGRTGDKTGVQPKNGINFWIELYRNGKTYRCNNKTTFQSGDAIRFHVIPQSDGYAYVVMKEGSSGKSSVLFPSKETGTSNFLNSDNDYPLPYKTWLQFDKHAGTEKVSLVFSKEKIDADADIKSQRYVTAYVSSDMTGSKDLVPTRMQLSWDDPTPVIIPDNFAGNSRLASVSNVHRTASSGGNNSSLVRLISSADGVLAVDIALSHH